MRLTFAHLRIPFRLRVKQATANRTCTDSIWVEARGEDPEPTGLGEGCPRRYQTGEDTRSALEWLEMRRPDFEALTDLAGLRELVAASRRELDVHPAAWCGVELALLDLFARRSRCTVEALLGVAETPPRRAGRRLATTILIAR